MAAVDRSIVANIPDLRRLGARGSRRDPGATPDPSGIRRVQALFRTGRGGAFVLSFCCTAICGLRKTTPQGEQIVVRYVSPGELFGVAQAMWRSDLSRRRRVAAVDSSVRWRGRPRSAGLG